MKPAKILSFDTDYGAKQAPAGKLSAVTLTAINLLVTAQRIHSHAESLLSPEEQEICDHATD